MFPRPSNILENPEWSPLWLVQPPLREMVPLSTYQLPVVPANSGANVDDAKATNDLEPALGVNVAALQPVHDPNDDANGMPLVTISRQEPSPSQELNKSIVLLPNTQTTLLSYPVLFPRNKTNDISENPKWSPLSCPAHISHLPIAVTLNVHFTLVSSSRVCPVSLLSS